jgi:hypothetical protein
MILIDSFFFLGFLRLALDLGVLFLKQILGNDPLNYSAQNERVEKMNKQV